MKTFKQFLKENPITEAPNDDRMRHAVKIANTKFQKPEYDEDPKTGQKIRKWRDTEDVSDKDIKQWLTGNRVIEDLKDGLEYVRPQTIQKLVDDGLLKKDPKANYYWVTKEAADKFDLKPVMDKKFPKAKEIPDREEKSVTQDKKHQQDDYAQKRANVLKQPVLLVRQNVTGSVYVTKEEAFKNSSEKSRKNYTILKRYEP